MTITFNIIAWDAWAPSAVDAQPDVSVIPAMLRRRLSPVARIAMSIIMPLAESYGAMPLVYVSRHGDLNRTFQLLKDLAVNEPLSPTAFSLSVHNATAGLFSIQQTLTKNITAMSGGAQEVIPALLEAFGQCTNEEPQVLCIFCDEPPPSIYKDQVNQPDIPYAVALILSRGDDWQLTSGIHQAQEATENALQPMALLSLLKQEVSHISLLHNDMTWQISGTAR